MRSLRLKYEEKTDIYEHGNCFVVIVEQVGLSKRHFFELMLTARHHVGSILSTMLQSGMCYLMGELCTLNEQLSLLI